MAVDEFKVTKKASLGGLDFAMDNAGEQGDNRIADHGYPKRDDHYLEDMGREANVFNVTGYVKVDASADSIRAFREVLQSRVSISFYHPYYNEMYRVRVDNWEINSDGNIGRVPVKFRAYKVDTGWQVAPISEASASASLESQQDTLQQGLEDYFEPLAYTATVNSDAIDIYSAINSAQSTYFEADRTSYRQYLAELQATTTATTTYVGNVVGLMDALYEDTLDSSTSFRLFGSLSQLTAVNTNVGSSGAAASQASQQAAMALVVRVEAIRVLAQVVIDHPYQDRQSAHDFRLSFMQIARDLQQDLSAAGESELFNQVACVVATVGSEYSRYTDALRPVAYTTQRTCALTLAWDLYQDPAQAEDIIARNSESFGFLSGTIEYLTP